MKILYSCQSVVEFDGTNYFSNPVLAAYHRYSVIGEDMTVLCFKKNVEIAKSDAIGIPSLRFVFVKKVNSIKAILKNYQKDNDKLVEEQVRDADICIVNLPNFHGNMVVKYAKKYHKPYMTVITGSIWDGYWNYGLRGKLMAPFAYYKMRMAQKDAPFSIYVTKQYLQSMYPTRGMSIGCSDADIKTGIEWVLEKRLLQISKIGLEKRPLRIGTVGAVNVPYKGHKYVIRAISILRKSGLVFEYHLLGKGDNTTLKQLAEKEGVLDLMVFHGQIPHEEVLSFYDDIDIYCQPSLTEGLPRSVVEAMSRGCLCIGSKVGGVPELIDDNYLFEKGDVSHIISLLCSVTPQILKENAERNFDKAKEYDINALNIIRKEFLFEFKNSQKY